MRLTSAIRLPLSTGASPVNLALGLGLVGFLGAAPVFIGSLLPEWTALPSGLLIAVWFFGLVALPFVAKRQRASDVVLDEEGVRVLGGPFRGRTLSWADVAASGPSFTESPQRGTTMHLPHGVEATSSEPDEIASFVDLGRTLEGLARGFAQSRQGVPAPAASPEVASCSACGAPLAPSASPTTRCAFCDAEVEVPEALRREVASLRALVVGRGATSRSIAALQRWPRAGTVNTALAAAVAPLVLGWPASAVLASEFFQYHDVFSWRDVLVLFASTAAFTLGLVFVVARQTAHRGAFALVVATFHARRLDVEGRHFGCHRCGAPLAATADGAVVTCAYCRADNVVLGLDLPPRVEAEAQQAASLDGMVAARARSMRTWRALSIAAAALVVGGAALLREPLVRAWTSDAARHPPVDRAWSYPGPAPR